MNRQYVGRFVFLGFLGFLLVFFTGACKARQGMESERPGTEKAEPEAVLFENEIMTLKTLSPVFGQAKEDASGIYDVIPSDNEFFIAYRFYAEEGTDVKEGISRDLMPKIENFYKTFKTPDRLYFGIYTANPTSLGQWTPYCSFFVTRKIARETEWTTLAVADFFKIVQGLKYAE